MISIIFATNNANKLRELRQIVGDRYLIRGLAETGCHEDIPEDADTLEGNALAKARWVHRRFHCACFADDTGLEVDILDGAPGVHSARYAGGEGHDSQANMQLLLDNLRDVPAAQRTARFRTVIAFIDEDGTEHLFHGKVEGSIATEPHGDGGFGYDPVFIPRGWDRSFAQTSPEEKNAISHRGRAVRQFSNWLTANK